MLIRYVEIDLAPVCVRVTRGRIETIARLLEPRVGETVIDGDGAALLPGLKDHHVHLFAAAAAIASIDVSSSPNLEDLAERIGGAATSAGQGWVRGIGFSGSAHDIDRDFLDACAGDVPVRIQHKSGRLWIINSAGLARLLEASGEPDPLERVAGRLTGRLYDDDPWLRSRTRSQVPDLGLIGAEMARYGITGVTDAGHGNDRQTFRALIEAQRSGKLNQDLQVFGGMDLGPDLDREGATVGAVKFHLHDNDHPNPSAFTASIIRAHDLGRPVAIHCVTVADLVLSLSCLEDAGAGVRDRLEHASVIPLELIDWIARLGITVVTQPHFIRERGDHYRRDVEPEERPWLYRVASLKRAGIPLAAGSDAPYGGSNPWASMQAAVDRRTRSGVPMGPDEALSPEAAFALFSSRLDSPGEPAAKLAPGQAADLCLLDRPWAAARRDLGAVAVRLTLKAGEPIWTSERVTALRRLEPNC